jgi:hypothetical protein
MTTGPIDYAGAIAAAMKASAPQASNSFGAQTQTVTINGQPVTGINPTTGKPPAAGGIGSISVSSNLPISSLERDKTQEAVALAAGVTPEYIASRGGINSQGYYNDTSLIRQLTAEERKQVTLPDGTMNTGAILSILEKKQKDFYYKEAYDKLKAENPGWTEENIISTATDTAKRQYYKNELGQRFDMAGNPIAGSGGQPGGYDAQGNPVVGGLYTSTGQLATSSTSTGGPGTTEQQQARKSAYDLLYEQFNQYGLGGLVEGIKGLVQENVSSSEFAIRLRQTDAYKRRFAANAQRIAQGLGAISEAEYIGLEDQYQNIMRQYGLPTSYYTKGEMGRQEGFEKFIGNDISAVELEDRIQTAQNRVINANPEVARALKEFYPDITNGDILAYTLDPKNAIKNIQRKVTAAEIGGAAMAQGLQTGLNRAEELAGYGVTKDQAQQGYQTVAEVAPRGSMLADIYKQDAYGQTQAEQEVFNLAGSADASRQRKKLTSLETSAFSGQSGVGVLGRERAGNI